MGKPLRNKQVSKRERDLIYKVLDNFFKLGSVKQWRFNYRDFLKEDIKIDVESYFVRDFVIWMPDKIEEFEWFTFEGERKKVHKPNVCCPHCDTLSGAPFCRFKYGENSNDGIKEVISNDSTFLLVFFHYKCTVCKKEYHNLDEKIWARLPQHVLNKLPISNITKKTWITTSLLASIYHQEIGGLSNEYIADGIRQAHHSTYGRRFTDYLENFDSSTPSNLKINSVSSSADKEGRKITSLFSRLNQIDDQIKLDEKTKEEFDDYECLYRIQIQDLTRSCRDTKNRKAKSDQGGRKVLNFGMQKTNAILNYEDEKKKAIFAGFGGALKFVGYHFSKPSNLYAVTGTKGKVSSKTEAELKTRVETWQKTIGNALVCNIRNHTRKGYTEITDTDSLKEFVTRMKEIEVKYKDHKSKKEQLEKQQKVELEKNDGLEKTNNTIDMQKLAFGDFDDATRYNGYKIDEAMIDTICSKCYELRKEMLISFMLTTKAEILKVDGNYKLAKAVYIYQENIDAQGKIVKTPSRPFNYIQAIQNEYGMGCPLVWE